MIYCTTHPNPPAVLQVRIWKADGGEGVANGARWKNKAVEIMDRSKEKSPLEIMENLREQIEAKYAISFHYLYAIQRQPDLWESTIQDSSDFN
jgi:hypothetical protein